jgi:hypothetical protein
VRAPLLRLYRVEGSVMELSNTALQRAVGRMFLLHRTEDLPDGPCIRRDWAPGAGPVGRTHTPAAVGVEWLPKRHAMATCRRASQPELPGCNDRRQASLHKPPPPTPRCTNSGSCLPGPRRDAVGCIDPDRIVNRRLVREYREISRSPRGDRLQKAPAQSASHLQGRRDLICTRG